MRTLIAFLAVAVLTVVSTASASAADPGVKATLSVEKIHATPSVREALQKAGKASSLDRVTESFDSQFIDHMHSTRKFQVTVVSDLATLIKAQDRTGQAAEEKKLNYGLIATLDDFADTTERLELPNSGSVAYRRTIRMSVVTKIYDVATGVIYETANIPCSQEEAGEESKSVARESGRSDQLLVSLVREAAQRVADRIVDAAFPAKVIDVDGKTLTINRGDGTGVAKGQVWDVFRLKGEVLVDPDTGEVLGRKRSRIGKARITEVDPKTSTAELTEGSDVAVGAELRLVTPAGK